MVRFIGDVPELPASTWIGVEWDEPVAQGRGDGSVKGGRQVFTAAKGRSAFVRPDRLKYGPQYTELDIDDL